MKRDNRQILVNPHSGLEKVPAGALNLGEIGVQHNNVEDAALYVETVADSESAETVAKFITEKAIDSKIENAIDIKKYAENKIVRISFTGKDFDSGIYIESKKNLYYMTGWMNPLEGISEDNYQAIISKAVEYFKSNSLIEICGIGKEIVVDYDNGLFDAIKNAHNVDVWMVSDLKYVTQKKQKYILIK